MNATAPAAPFARLSRVHVAGLVLLGLFAASIALQWPWHGVLQTPWFDACQRLAPRVPAALPVTIVEIDDRSVASLGRWPWPRSVLADLVEAIARHRPAVVGIDFLLADAEPVGARRGAAQARIPDNRAAAVGGDAELAAALRSVPAVVAIAPIPAPSPAGLRVAPVTVVSHAGAGTAAQATPPVPTYRGALASLPLLAEAARGWGVIPLDDTADVARRLPLFASVDGTLVPAFALEMWRVALGAASVEMRLGADGVASVSAGTLHVPTERDGSVRVHYGAHAAQRFVAALDVLENRVPTTALTGKLVIVGLTASVPRETVTLPGGARVPGAELQAQVVEALRSGALLERPRYAAAAEAIAFLALGALLVWATSRWVPRASAALALALVALPLAGAYAAFVRANLLLDAATPAALVLLLYGVMLALTLAETTRQRGALQGALAAEREAAARVTGELEAARRIQLATLPQPDSLHDERVAVAATMAPAREVGGDLYDFFKLDRDRLFFMVGDVAGKGVSASMFMAVTKALCKSAMLRAPDHDLGALLATVNAEISRDNPHMLFVSACAAVLDLADGSLAFCNAGHERPWVLRTRPPMAWPLAQTGGPPLCALPAFDYRGDELTLVRGDVVVMVTDGVAEARDAQGRLYGRERLGALLARLAHQEPAAQVVVDAVCADVAAFAAGTEAADDLAVLAVQWDDAAAASEKAGSQARARMLERSAERPA